MAFHILAYAESNAVVKMINKCICDVIMTSFVMVNRWLTVKTLFKACTSNLNLLLGCQLIKSGILSTIKMYI